MKRTPTHLGDSHNFGRRVRLRAGRIVKPRTVLWEWLLLSAKSPLRRLLAEAAHADGLGRQAFDFLPSLKFYSTETEPTGEVERVELKALPALSREQRRELAQIAGRSLALFTWLGLSDLHWENLVIGADARGRLVFGPLDVEMILADLSLPTETKLLPDPDPEYAVLCQHACGVRRVLPYLGKPVAPQDLLAMIAAFRRTLAFLERHSSAIADVFTSLPSLRETPIRVCLRSTGDYVRARSESASLWPPLLDAEAEQLARGDIPYFFRLYGRRGIHYYGDEALTEWKTLPLKGDVPKLDPLLQLARGLRSPSRKKLREEGPFTLLGAFDHPSFSGKVSSDELEVAFGPRALVMSFPDGEELHSRRNLSAFVSSVYQPCHCGEVRSVFVPEVTVCDAARRRSR
jgi:hypothetical protein